MQKKMHTLDEICAAIDTDGQGPSYYRRSDGEIFSFTRDDIRFMEDPKFSEEVLAQVGPKNVTIDFYCVFHGGRQLYEEYKMGNPGVVKMPFLNDTKRLEILMQFCEFLSDEERNILNHAILNPNDYLLSYYSQGSLPSNERLSEKLIESHRYWGRLMSTTIDAAMDNLGYSEKWRLYLREKISKVARRWCQDNGIEYEGANFKLRPQNPNLDRLSVHECDSHDVDEYHSPNESQFEYVSDSELIRAIKNGELALAQQLITDGANVNVVMKYPAESPLYTAVDENQIELVKLLLAHGAIVDPPPNAFGNTPLCCAITKNPEIAKMLISLGADVNRNGIGATPLMCAASRGDFELMDLLLRSGAELNGRNQRGDTALMYAAAMDRLAACKFLVEKGIDYKIRNLEGKSALDLAREFNKMKCLNYLEVLPR